jgi:hypothetical protein
MDVTDEYGIALRLKPWIAFKSDIARWFTWETTHWSANNNEPDKTPKNVFVNPVTFDCGGPAGYGNGDGTMFYPGQDDVYPAQDRGYPGPISSIRMKMYRRGVQDYEYMWLARHAGWGAQVTAILDDLLPHVMWDAVTVPDWSNRNADYETARRQFADLALQSSQFRVVLEVHPNERAPGASTNQYIGKAPWTQPASSPASSYWWKKYEFAAHGPLWVQICAQNWDKVQKGYADHDDTQLQFPLLGPMIPVDYDGIQSGAPGSWQWAGGAESGKRTALRFLVPVTPGKQVLWIGADESPVLWWLKVTDLEPGLMEAF